MKRLIRLCTTLLSVAVLAIGTGVALTPTPASGFACPCFFPPGPYKVWVMLDTATVALIDCTTGQITGTVDVGGGCNSIVSKPDCSQVFVGNVGIPGVKPPGFCDIDCVTLQVIERPLPAPPIPNGMVCKGNIVVVAMENGQVAFFNCDTGQLSFVTVGGGCNSIIAKCFGPNVFVGTAGIPGVKGPGFCDIDCNTLQVIERPLPVPTVPNAFWLTADDCKLWIMLQDFSVFVYDCCLNQVVAQIPIGGACNSIVGKCDGSSIFLGNVGGGVPQDFFPPAGFPPQGGGPTSGIGGGNFIVDSFFDISFEAEIDIPGIGQGQMSQKNGNEARGDGAVQRGDVQRNWLGDPATEQASIPIELVALSLQSVAPVQFNVDSFFDIALQITPGAPGGGQIFGDPDLASGDFPVQPVQSSFDVFFDITVSDPSGVLPPCTFRSAQPIPLELDPNGPPLIQIPFACDWWRVPPGFPPVPFFNLDPTNPIWPPDIFVTCDRICFPPPPPPKPSGVCDIDCATFQIIQDCPLPDRPIPCGVAIKPGDQQIWVAMENGTVGVWDCFWNLINPGIPLGGGCTSIVWKPDMSAVFVGTAGGNGNPPKPPGICDIDPLDFQVSELPTPGVPLPKGIWICQAPATFPCDGDANSDGVVDINDIAYVIFRLGTCIVGGTPCANGCDGDANGDGVVDINDISYVIFRLGSCNPQAFPCP